MKLRERAAWVVSQLLARCSALALGLSVAGALLRVVARDRYAWSAPLAYALPWPVLLAIASAAAAGFALRRRKRLCLVALTSCLASGAALLATRIVPARELGGGGVQGLFWNLQRGRGGWEPIADAIARAQPEIAAFVEAAREPVDWDAALARALPQHERRWLGDGIALAARHAILHGELRALPGGGRVGLAEVDTTTGPIRIAIVDLPSSPWRSRAQSFRSLTALLDGLDGEPLLVVGDFNTPRDSVYFDAWRSKLTHAFEAAGEGYDATWPTPLPVLAIDHVWGGRGVVFEGCALGSGDVSDHRSVSFRFSAPASPSE